MSSRRRSPRNRSPRSRSPSARRVSPDRARSPRSSPRAMQSPSRVVDTLVQQFTRNLNRELPNIRFAPGALERLQLELRQYIQNIAQPAASGADQPMGAKRRRMHKRRRHSRSRSTSRSGSKRRMRSCSGSKRRRSSRK